MTRPRPRAHEAWCHCGIRIAGTPLQIAYAAEVHWRICPVPWQLLDHDPKALGGAA